MNMKLKKVIGDLRINPGRIILVIFALIIGLWGVGSILVSYTILSRDLNANFVRTIPLSCCPNVQRFPPPGSGSFEKPS